MGIAAYNRGTAALRRDISAQLPDHNSVVVRSINALPRGTAVLFQPTVIRLLPTGRTWCLMNRKDRGFASSCFEYGTLRELFAKWDCYVTGFGRDEHSFFYEVSPSEE